ncbi:MULTISPECIES: phosphate ABC transporter permease PstA [Micromonospora]|uniref:Phosphate transport system permease protein PstA n=2 Tax=Micromonospora TaxID=1873 RepID=A0A9X0I0D6_9ACTN|nr:MULTISPECIES: phosphate ABC transporter permease PstA [Micromonospora]AEB45074.1 phosphate ABC transporter inner membrane subunit PstA [Micromonospora maris AB-18-032]KUJ44505.1 phosphate ABC transporter permease [Micromonospora maris]MBL6276420.1 phosphate ABC transporter permease PstA [Micromonospora fiedleri]RUL92350.1 phosphate ABC transporter permease PstA [Verrucosispora sp. FIM060022]WSK40408.1 phosphate ABC transporter permease PstA [Micromonospora maris]
MSVTAPPATRPAAGRPDLTRAALSGRRRFTNHLATAAIWGAVLLAVIPLALVTYTVIGKGAGVMSLSFLTEDIPNSYRREGGGMAPAIIGTLVITGAAALMAIPLGVFGAIYLNEYGKQKPLARVIRLMADVMTGVPSIVMGLFVYISWVLLVGQQTGFAGALALACLMLPVVIRSSEEMLRLVPEELRQASMALGARKWKTTLTVVLPAAISGITSGSLLAVARAAGETAPIIIVTGIVFTPNWNLFDGSNTALPAQIFRNASTSFPAAQDRAWGAALTLIVIVLSFTVIARFISSRFAIKER